MPKAAATPSAIARQKKRMRKLKQRDEERQEKRKAQVQAWFDEFDTNNDRQLQRDELRALLTHLQPSAPPKEESLDFLIERATRIESSSLSIAGNKNGAVSFHCAIETVLRYVDYVREEAFLSKIFADFDKDGNGTLEKGELLPLLKQCAPEGCVVEAADAEYVLSLCDVNKNGTIDREEVTPLVARWKQLARERLDEQQQEVEAEASKSSRSSFAEGILERSATARFTLSRSNTRRSNRNITSESASQRPRSRWGGLRSLAFFLRQSSRVQPASPPREVGGAVSSPTPAGSSVDGKAESDAEHRSRVVLSGDMQVSDIIQTPRSPTLSSPSQSQSLRPSKEPA